MKRVWIALSIIIIVTWVFIYWLTILSNLNTCSWVRSFDCEKANKKNLVSWSDYDKLNKIWNTFLDYCKPVIKNNNLVYSLDYSNCDLNINISKTNSLVESVFINWVNLSKDEININLK